MTGKTTPEAEVSAFMRKLKHPLKPQIEAVRKMMLAASPRVHEGIKWNAPSFRTGDWFATVHLRGQGSLQLILHTGARAKGAVMKNIADPAGLLKWLAEDRCMATLPADSGFKPALAALKKIVKSWIKQMPAKTGA